MSTADAHSQLFESYIAEMGLYFGAEDPDDWNKEELKDFFININTYFDDEHVPVKVGETPSECEWELTEHGQKLQDAIRSFCEDYKARLSSEQNDEAALNAAADGLLRDLASTMYGPA